VLADQVGKRHERLLQDFVEAHPGRRIAAWAAIYFYLSSSS
jgi:hypothetical protein